jgi:ribonuclease D
MTENVSGDVPVFVQTDQAATQFLGGLAGQQLLAVDTEAASFHRYHDRTYLLQLSTRTQTAVIDPLVVTELGGLRRLLSDPSVEVIFHDADYDLRMLDRDYQFRVNHIFDTRLAAQLLNEPGVGLAALLEKYFGITLDKKYQRADWSRRPLLPEMLAYAAMDTKYLPQLRDILRDKLVSMGRWSWAEEEFSQLTTIRWSPGTDEGFWKLKGAKVLRGQGIAVLRALYQWRDQLARQLDKAPFRVLNNETLIELARLQPRDRTSLAAVRGLNPDTLQRRGDDILHAITRGVGTPEDEIPRLERGARIKPDPAFVARVERLKAARNAAAIRLDLAPGVLCPNGTLEGVAKVNPRNHADFDQVSDLRHWQRDVLGDELLAALRERPGT